MLLRKRNLGILAIIILIPVIGIAWWLLAPLFTSTTVEEEFPFAVTASVPPDMTRAQVEQVMSGILVRQRPTGQGQRGGGIQSGGTRDGATAEGR